MDALTVFSYGVVGYLVAPVLVWVLASLHKETRHGQPLRGILSFYVVMLALCAIIILFTTLHCAITFHKADDRIETYHQPR
jgi:hypothetical protein